MAVIYAPNKEYTGLSAGVSFVNGRAVTDDPDRIKWFSSHGYIVERPAPEKPAVRTRKGKKKGE